MSTIQTILELAIPGVITFLPSLLFGILVVFSFLSGNNSYQYLFFLASYIPLYPIIVAKTTGQSYTILGIELTGFDFLNISWSMFSILAVVLFVVAVGYLLAILGLAHVLHGEVIEVELIENITPVANEYILVYIYPLLLLDYGNLFDIVVFLIVFVSVSIIQVRTDRYMINPILVFLDYKFQYVEANGKKLFLLTKESIDGNDTVEVPQVSISEHVRIDDK